MSGFRPESLWTGKRGGQVKGGERTFSVGTATPPSSWTSKVHHAFTCRRSGCKLRLGKIKRPVKLSCDDKEWPSMWICFLKITGGAVQRLAQRRHSKHTPWPWVGTENEWMKIKSSRSTEPAAAAAAAVRCPLKLQHVPSSKHWSYRSSALVNSYSCQLMRLILSHSDLCSDTREWRCGRCAYMFTFLPSLTHPEPKGRWFTYGSERYPLSIITNTPSHTPLLHWLPVLSLSVLASCFGSAPVIITQSRAQGRLPCEIRVLFSLIS